MPKSSLNMKVDSDLKNQAEYLFKELGMSMSTAVTVFLKQAVREGKIPFSISTLNATPNKETNKVLSEANRGINMSKKYSSFEELKNNFLDEKGLNHTVDLRKTQIPNQQTLQAIKDSMDENNLSNSYDSTQELMADLLNEED